MGYFYAQNEIILQDNLWEVYISLISAKIKVMNFYEAIVFESFAPMHFL